MCVMHRSVSGPAFVGPALGHTERGSDRLLGCPLSFPSPLRFPVGVNLRPLLLVVGVPRPLHPCALVRWCVVSLCVGASAGA
jgi:hypothetical protein